MCPTTLCSEYSFLRGSTLNTSPKSCLQKWCQVLYPYHTWDLRLGIPYKVIPWSQWLRLHKLTSSNLGLMTWDRVWTGLRFMVVLATVKNAYTCGCYIVHLSCFFFILYCSYLILQICDALANLRQNINQYRIPHLI